MFNVMLAKSMVANDDTITQLTGTHYFDLKQDGIRAVLAINEGAVTITNRNGVNITGRYPEVAVGALKKFGDTARLVLDGEIVVIVDGTPSFKNTAKRDRQQKPAVIAALSQSMPATFIAFDVLYHNGSDMRREEYLNRKATLDSLLSTFEPGNQTVVPNVGSMDGHKLLSLVRQYGLEGLVAKRLESIYQAGRRSDWIKIKPTQTISCIVAGFSAGTGARAATFGALSLRLLDDDGNRVDVGEVGTGFKQKDLLEIQEILNNPASGPLIVEVEFQEFTVDGSLRFPVFKGIRTDVKLEDCTLAQIKVLEIEEVPS